MDKLPPLLQLVGESLPIPKPKNENPPVLKLHIPEPVIEFEDDDDLFDGLSVEDWARAQMTPEWMAKVLANNLANAERQAAEPEGGG